jgi:hypothetical protein
MKRDVIGLDHRLVCSWVRLLQQRNLGCEAWLVSCSLYGHYAASSECTLVLPNRFDVYILSSLPISRCLPYNVCGCLYNQLMLVRLHPLPQLLQVFAFVTLNLSRHNHLSLINLLDDVMYHDARFVVFEIAGLKIVKGSFDA